MQTQTKAIPQKTKGKRAELFVRVAQNTDEILNAQRLRYKVFSEEYQASIHTPVPGIDCDQYDAACDHLIVYNNLNGEVVATTRLLSEDKLGEVGQFYSEGEFELQSVLALPGRKLEIGRTCVSAEFRNGATLALLWSGIARYVIENRFDYLIGCGSIPVGESTAEAWAVANQLNATHGIEAPYRVSPRTPLPPPEQALESATVPPLIKAYTRLGAKIGGEPCWDPDFRCADLFIVLHLSALEARYSRHFLKKNNEQ